MQAYDDEKDKQIQKADAAGEVSLPELTSTSFRIDLGF